MKKAEVVQVIEVLEIIIKRLDNIERRLNNLERPAPAFPPNPWPTTPYAYPAYPYPRRPEIECKVDSVPGPPLMADEE